MAITPLQHWGHRASGVTSWGCLLSFAPCPLCSPGWYQPQRVLITHLWDDLGWRRSLGVPSLREGPASYSGQCQHWIQSRLHGKAIPWDGESWQHSLSVSETSLKRVAQLHSGVERKVRIFLPLNPWLHCWCTILKQPFLFLNSSASQNLHLWDSTAEEEKITRKVLNASSPE